MNSEPHQVARLQEKLSSGELVINELLQTLGEKEKELKDSAAECSTLTGKVSSLHQHVQRFRMRSVRAKGTGSRAIEEAVERAKKHFESANAKRVT